MLRKMFLFAIIYALYVLWSSGAFALDARLLDMEPIDVAATDSELGTFGEAHYRSYGTEGIQVMSLSEVRAQTTGTKMPNIIRYDEVLKEFSMMEIISAGERVSTEKHMVFVNLATRYNIPIYVVVHIKDNLSPMVFSYIDNQALWPMDAVEAARRKK